MGFYSLVSLFLFTRLRRLHIRHMQLYTTISAGDSRLTNVDTNWKNSSFSLPARAKKNIAKNIDVQRNLFFFFWIYASLHLYIYTSIYPFLNVSFLSSLGYIINYKNQAVINQHMCIVLIRRPQEKPQEYYCIFPNWLSKEFHPMNGKKRDSEVYLATNFEISGVTNKR